ncbi:uncharacterized protein LOC113471941 [Diaphorina citri]|uniref:Uncharacterized protein LOC113471941 n=1 Tax=Diaphorina citri TaxID=121845 RepID=A0A3Q0JFI7_DIACI|nr:uncharacterized protein LOC113471941 [Diaphorina citri]
MSGYGPFELKTKNSKQVLNYGGEEFFYSAPQKDRQLLFKCVHLKCLATLKLNREKTTIVGGKTTHSNHPEPTPPKPPRNPGKTTPNALHRNPNLRRNSTPTTYSLTKDNMRPSYSSKLTPSSQPPSDSHQSNQSRNSKRGSEKFNSSIPDVSVSSNDQLDVSSSVPMNSVSREMNLLKELNSQLLQRIKALEEELKTTKATCEELILSTLEKPGEGTRDQMVLEESSSSSEQDQHNLQDHQFPSYDDSSPCRRRLLICGDSMTRNFGPILKSLLPDYSVECLTFPGASLSFAIKDLGQLTKNFTKNDIIFILAGSNDVPLLTLQQIEKEFQYLRNRSQETNIIISSIPFKFHKTKHNSNIFATNQSLLSLSVKYNFFYFECNFFLSRRMYTRHGLHFNKFGKNTYCTNLSRCLPSLNVTINRFLLPNPVSAPEVIIMDGVDDGLITDITCPYLNNDSILNLSNNRSTQPDISTLSDETFTDLSRDRRTFFLS